jgi:hypothetical protein
VTRLAARSLHGGRVSRLAALLAIVMGAVAAAPSGASASQTLRAAPVAARETGSSVVGAAVTSSARTYGSGLAAPVRIKATPSGQGFFLLSPDGKVHGYGDAVAMGDAQLPHPAVSLAVTKSGLGYWVFDADGCTAAFGDAGNFTQTICGKSLNGPILDAATTPDGKGYWLVANDGGMFTFGDAPFLGSMGGKPLNAPVVGMAPSPSGSGYWEVASDGGIFAFSARRSSGRWAPPTSTGRSSAWSPLVPAT